MGRVGRAIGRAVRGVVRGVGRVVSGVAKGVGKVVGGAFKLAGNIAKGVLGSPLLMGIGGGLLGFTIGGPIGAMLGAGGGAMLGQSFGQMFNGTPQMTGQMGMNMMPQMGMPMAGMMGGMPGMMGGMPGMGMMGGMGYPSSMGMMPGGMGGYSQMGMMQQQQMMMMMMMMMMMQQQQMMMGGGGFPQGMMPMTGGMRGFMGTPGGMPSMGYPGFPSPMMQPSGNVPYNPVSGSNIANVAAGWNGQHFKPGQTCRCADFVSTVLKQSGQAPPGFKHQVSCSQLQKYGTPVGKDQLKPGDVVFFGNTYRPGKYTHTGIYLGNGKFAHRPTANKPVRVDNLSSGYYANHYSGARRMA